MMQLVGGVAVAGAVAAGSTAFTGAGMSSGLTNAFIGGAVSKTVVSGADLTGVQGTVNNGTDQIAEVKLTFATDTNIVGRTVTLTTNGSAGGGSPTGFYCQVVQSDYTALCKAGTAYANPVGYYTTITSMTAAVL
ncbi:hypothetical protein FB565_005153 [Actinoplanes lutulentus]|nr:hypothetical protein [Actinoplanes lutulentus]MBB2945420.1 hypothetical protein [Actinoplanes lutulentus]